MRILVISLCLLFCLSANAQKRNKKKKQHADYTASVILSQLGRSLYNYEVAATSSNKTNSSYEWRFILAEESLRGKVNKNMADQLTSFLFSFQPNTNGYSGEIIRAREGLDRHRVLAMVYQLFVNNVRRFGSDIDFVRLDGKFYYILYFPNEKETFVRS